MRPHVYFCFGDMLNNSHEETAQSYCDETQRKSMERTLVHLKDKYIYHNQGFETSIWSNGRQHDIKRTESFIVLNNTTKVVIPGEFVEIYADKLKCFEGEVAVECHMQFPFSGNWLAPSVNRVIQGSIQIPSLSKERFHISRSQQIAQIRRVNVPLQIQDLSVNSPSVSTRLSRDTSKGSSYTNLSATVSTDHKGQLTTKQRQEFSSLNKSSGSVFPPQVGCYND